jgi:hypothetical protein
MSTHRLCVDAIQPVGTWRVVPSVVPARSVSTGTPILGFSTSPPPLLLLLI